jgi:hypothetical protein
MLNQQNTAIFVGGHNTDSETGEDLDATQENIVPIKTTSYAGFSAGIKKFQTYTHNPR